MALCSDVTSASVMTKQALWIAVEVRSMITDQHLHESLSTFPGTLMNMALDIKVGSGCTISRVVGPQTREAFYGDDTWIVFVEVIAEPIPGTDGSPLQGHSPLRSRPSSRQLMDQLHGMLSPTFSTHSHGPSMPIPQDLLKVTLHFEHSCVPPDVQMSLGATWTLERVSPWVLESRTPPKSNNEISRWDLHTKALRLADCYEDISSLEKLSFLDSIFGKDCSKAVPQLKKAAKGLMTHLRHEITAVRPLKAKRLEKARRNGMEGSEADRDAMLADLVYYIENGTPERKRADPLQRPNPRCGSPLKIAAQAAPPVHEPPSRRRFDNNTDSLRDVTNRSGNKHNGKRQMKTADPDNLRRGSGIWQELDGRDSSPSKLKPSPLFPRKRHHQVRYNPQRSCMPDPMRIVNENYHSAMDLTPRKHHPWREQLRSFSQESIFDDSEPCQTSSSNRTSGDHAHMSYGTFVSSPVKQQSTWKDNTVNEVDSGYGPASSLLSRPSVEDNRDWLGIPKDRRGNTEDSRWFEDYHKGDVGIMQGQRSRSDEAQRAFSGETSEGHYADDEDEEQESEEDEARRIWAQIEESSSPRKKGEEFLTLNKERFSGVSLGVTTRGSKAGDEKETEAGVEHHDFGDE